MLRRWAILAPMFCLFAACSAAKEDGTAPPVPPAPPADGGTAPGDGSADAVAPKEDAARDDAAVFVDPATNPSPECVKYCGLMEAMCTGQLVQYTSRAACYRACVDIPVGVLGDYTNNTLACRVQHAEAAATIPPHCGHAGAFGGDGCGPNCESFCQVAFGKWCSGAPKRSFASVAECLAACPTFKHAPPINEDGHWPYWAGGPTSGNSIECRMHELIVAFDSVANRDFYLRTRGGRRAGVQVTARL